MVIVADPGHRLRSLDACQDGQAPEHRAGPAYPAVAGNFDQFSGLGAPMGIDDRLKDLALIGGQPEVLPPDELKRPRDFRVLPPSLVKVEREIWRARTFRRDQSQPPTSEHRCPVRQGYFHPHSLPANPFADEGLMLGQPSTISARRKALRITSR